MASTMKYMYEAQVAFQKEDSNIYRIIKDKTNDLKKGKYITATEVVRILNDMPYKIALYDNRMVFIHANFELEGEQ